MPSVQDILAAKGSHVHAISPNAAVLEAVQKMNQHKIGALVVMQDGRVIGMFTERDVLRRIVGEQRNPSTVTVGEAMTSEVICIGPDEDLDEVSTVMKNRRIRHLPVCDEDGRLSGMISIGDLNAFNANHQEATIHFLNEYIYGRV
jgi:CBS domain-containing protein